MNLPHAYTSTHTCIIRIHTQHAYTHTHAQTHRVSKDIEKSYIHIRIRIRPFTNGIWFMTLTCHGLKWSRQYMYMYKLMYSVWFESTTPNGLLQLWRAIEWWCAWTVSSGAAVAAIIGTYWWNRSAYAVWKVIWYAIETT